MLPHEVTSVSRASLRRLLYTDPLKEIQEKKVCLEDIARPSIEPNGSDEDIIAD